MTFEYQQHAEAVADRKHLPSHAEADGVMRNLGRLEQLSAAFASAAKITGEARPVLFRWRDLEVECAIDAGGFGEVYRAWDPTLKRPVALKLVPKDVQSESRDRLMIAEAQRMARLRHTNILAVHGADVADGRAGIWCDLLDGQTLEQLVASHGPLSSDAVIKLAEPLADALRLVHIKAMSHGDVKPANIMIEPDGTPVLMDFGAVQAALVDNAGYGSPLVMAPEQLAGAPASPASDRYALGCTLFYALTGRYPIEAQSIEALQERHQDRSKVDYSLLPREWRKLLQQLLEPDPKNRMFAEQLTNKLERLRTRKTRRRRQLAVGAIGFSLALAAGSAWWAAYATNRDASRLEQVRAVFVQALNATNLLEQSGPPSFQPFYDNLYEQSQEKLGSYPKAQGQIFSLVGAGYEFLDESELADEATKRALEVMRSAPNVSALELASVWLDRSASLRVAEKFDESEDAARAALVLLDASDDPEAAKIRLSALNRIAMLHLHRGQIRESIQAHEEVLRRRIAMYGADSVRPAVDYFNIATSQHSIGLDFESVANYEQAAKLLKANGDEESERMGYVMHGIAESLAYINPEKAQIHVHEARRLYNNALLPADHRRQLTLDLTQIEIWREQGDAARTEPPLRELLMRSDLTGKQVGQIRSSLAATLMDLGKWTEAAEQFGLLLALDSEQFAPLKPYYAAAQQYASYRGNSLQPSPLPAIRDAQVALAQIDRERTQPYLAMDRWVNELNTIAGLQ